MTSQGQSTYTPQKEQVLGRILAQHLRIVQAIFDKPTNAEWISDRTYYYFDIFAGSGTNEEARCPGSPQLFWQTVERFAYPYEAMFIENDPQRFHRLSDLIPTNGYSMAICADNAEILPDAIRNLPTPKSFGLIYADPNNCPPFELLADVSRDPHCARLDILIHAPSTTIKRVRRAYGRQPDLITALGKINKKYWLIRDAEGTGKNQWTFLLGSNWDGFKDYRAIAMHRLESERGRAILEELNYTKEEREQLHQPCLLDYHSYEEYRKLPEFRAVRALVFARANGLCERCGQRPPTEDHHLRYPQWGTLDVPENMIAVCHQCHCDLHGKEN